jgi:hypothetical protein
MKFLNVDLEIESRPNLEPLLSALGDRVYVLHAESKPNKRCAFLEISRYWRNPTPDRVIGSLCDLLDNLPPKAKQTWQKARRKTFSIGVELNPTERAGHMNLSNESLRRISTLGGTVNVTCYCFRDQINTPFSGAKTGRSPKAPPNILR